MGLLRDKWSQKPNCSEPISWMMRCKTIVVRKEKTAKKRKKHKIDKLHRQTTLSRTRKGFVWFTGYWSREQGKWDADYWIMVQFSGGGGRSNNTSTVRKLCFLHKFIVKHHKSAEKIENWRYFASFWNSIYGEKKRFGPRKSAETYKNRLNPHTKARN